MTTASLEVLPLATMSLTVRPPEVIAESPSGTRWIVEAEAGRIDGERIHAAVKRGSSADWFVMGGSDTGIVDARLLAETDDGALVLLQYGGRMDLGAGRDAPIYVAPSFETGDERYRWLNVVQAVGKGTFRDSRTLVYELYEVR